MNALSKTLLAALLLVGTYSAVAQTQKAAPSRPFYTGIIDPQITHLHNVDLTERELYTNRTTPIHQLYNGETGSEEGSLNTECVKVVGMLEGIWSVPGVINVKDLHPEKKGGPNKDFVTLILRSYDAKFTMVMSKDSLNNLHDANGRLQPGETYMLLGTKGRSAGLTSDRYRNEPYKRICTVQVP